jgi:hypothetical protein
LPGRQPGEQFSHSYFGTKIAANKVRDYAVHLIAGFEYAAQSGSSCLLFTSIVSVGIGSFQNSSTKLARRGSTDSTSAP